MKRFRSLAVLASFAAFACLAGCSDDSGGDDAPLAKLDLRIKKAGIAYSGGTEAASASVVYAPGAGGGLGGFASSSRSVEEKDGDLWNADKTETTNCKVENIEGGLKFTIKKPAGFSEGFGYVAIYRVEQINGKETGTTKAVVDCWGSTEDSVDCTYPLCEPGERYVFYVQIEPKVADRDLQRYEYLSIKAESGIGDIDYTGLSDSRHCTLSWDGSKASVELIDCIAPNNAKNLKADVGLFLCRGSVDWETNGATTYYGSSFKSGETYRVITDTIYNGTEDQAVKAPLSDGKGDYTHFFAQYSFEFQVDGATGIKSWGTGAVESKVCSF